MFEDFGEAAKALREADARRDSIFAQSVDAQKNKDDVMAKKFAEAVKKAKETPLTDRLSAGLRSGLGPWGRPAKKKISLKKVENFTRPKSDRQLASFYHAFHHELTTKNHVHHPVFSKTPSKNTYPPRQKK